VIRNTIKQAVKDALSEQRAEEELRKNDKPIRTIEDLKGMSADDINRRWPEVSAVLEAAEQEEGDDVNDDE
jgi:hypothetical protein